MYSDKDRIYCKAMKLFLVWCVKAFSFWRNCSMVLRTIYLKHPLFGVLAAQEKRTVLIINTPLSGVGQFKPLQ